MWGPRACLTLLRVASVMLCVGFTVEAQLCNTPGWYDFGDWQYRFVIYPTRSFNNSRSYCQSQGGDLAVITTGEQNEFLAAYAPTICKVCNYWIGVHNAGRDGNFKWINDTLLGFSNWRLPVSSGGPYVRLLSKKDNTMKINGLWQRSEDRERVHICQRQRDYRCLWSLQGESYYRVVGARESFAGAKTKCIESGGDLAVVRSSGLNTFLTSLISPATSSRQCYWLGLQNESSNGAFRWVDNSSLSDNFTAWATDETSKADTGCVCLSSESSDQHGRWYANNCTESKPYICERLREPGGQWREYGTTLYLVSPFETNYFAATEYCSQLGGTLAQPKTADINKFLRSLVVASATFWIGLDDLKKEGEFRWADGSLWTKTGNVNLRADNGNGVEDCVRSINGSYWNDKPCQGNMMFICEISRAPPIHLTAVTSTPYGTLPGAPSYSCLISSSHEASEISTYTERLVRPDLNAQDTTLTAPGTTKSPSSLQLTQVLPMNRSAAGVFTCTSTHMVTGTTTSVPITLLLHDRHFQPANGSFTRRVQEGENITLSVTSMTSPGQIRWSKFSNIAEGSLSPESDDSLSYRIIAATNSDANVYGTYLDNQLDDHQYSLIRVIVSDCPQGKWNIPSCDRLCDNCYNGGICHPQSGTCICAPGFSGRNCLTACGSSRYGWECDLECGPNKILQSCTGSQICLPDPYGCNCIAGYGGVNCNQTCSLSTYGAGCLQECHCLDGIRCDRFTGQCDGECAEKWSGPACQVPSTCPDGYFGENCTDHCNCPQNAKCEQKSGYCMETEGDCRIGYVSDSIEVPDSCAKYMGCYASCSKTCHCLAGPKDCDQDTGTCTSGACLPRWLGSSCQTDRFEVVRKRSNPGVAFFSCNVTWPSGTLANTREIRGAIGSFDNTNEVFSNQTTVLGTDKTMATFIVEDFVEGQPLYCFIGDSSNKATFAYARLPHSYPYELPAIKTPPEEKSCGLNHVIIRWRSWNSSVDDGDGPVIAYNVYITAERNPTVMFTRKVNANADESTRTRKTTGIPDSSYVIHNVTGLQPATSYDIQIAAIREGLNGEGPSGPVVTVTTLAIRDGEDGMSAIPPVGGAVGDEVDDGGTNTSAIPVIGGAVGGVAVILAVIIIAVFVCKKIRSAEKDETRFDSCSYLKSDAPNKTDLETSGREMETIEPAAPNQLCLSSLSSLSRSDRSAIPVAEFAIFVQKNRHTDFFADEFHTLPKANIHPQTAAEMTQNYEKNRYKNVLPYDKARVVLAPVNDDPHSDYYNASYLSDGDRNRAYIACQGPTNASVDDFWRMVWQENVATIAMVTNLQEGRKVKCRQYWPQDEGSTTYGGILIVHDSTDACTGGSKRTLKLHSGDETKTVTQFHFTEWPDKDVPKHTSSLLMFLKEVKANYGTTKSPLLVHCSAGVGRTGVVIGIDAIVPQAQRTGMVDIFSFASAMRQARPYMIQTEEQYAFLYEAVLEGLMWKETAIPVDRFHLCLMSLKEGGPNSRLSQEFENLKILCADPHPSTLQTGTRADNRPRSRYDNNLPMQRNRVMLRSGASADSDFINASFIQGTSCRFITTQMPMPRTVADFWSMIVDYTPSGIVMLNDVEQSDETCAQYWLDSDAATFGPFSVSTLDISEESDVITRTLHVAHEASQAQHVIRQYQFLRWPQKPSEWDSGATSLLKVQQEILDYPNSEGCSIVVHCLSGVGRTGVFCTVMECVGQIQGSGTVDVFQTVKKLRADRMQFVQTKEEYTFIYETIDRYLTANKYQQLPSLSNDPVYGNTASGGGEQEQIQNASELVYENITYQS